MKPKASFTITSADIEKVHALVSSRKSDAFLLEREERNVIGVAPIFDREEFWRVLLGCLLTTQQRSTQGSPVDRFTEQKPFLLPLRECSQDVQKTVISVLTNFGGIRMAPTIGHRARLNYQWLNNSGWARVEDQFQKLATQRNRAPHTADARAEREAAYFAAEAFAGIGPKQSRNLWQWLGLTRYEIPLDSRICKWISTNLSVKVETKYLGDEQYYDAVLDYIHRLCERAGVLPCIFDAAAFDYDQKGIPLEVLMSRISKGTTETGYLNLNGQVVIRDTGVPGTDKFQRIYQLACSKCGHNYGANGSDCHLRLCPKCQGGAQGLPIGIGTHA
jgi:hypothetical protein